MRVVGIDHVQLALPAGGGDAARAFYRDLLGFEEVVKPPELRSRGGLWFRLGPLELHLGVDPEFRPARKAHPGLLVEGLDEMASDLRRAGRDAAVERDVAGRRRIYLDDPFGNRLEFIEWCG